MLLPIRGMIVARYARLSRLQVIPPLFHEKKAPFILVEIKNATRLAVLSNACLEKLKTTNAWLDVLINAMQLSFLSWLSHVLRY
jgi:hypothetical protein